MSLAGLIALVLVSSLHLMAQEPEALQEQLDQPDESASSSSQLVATPAAIFPLSAVGTQAIYTPLTLKQKWEFSVSKVFGPSRLAGYAAHALYGDIFNSPKHWGSGEDSLAVRLAGNFGNSLIRHNLEFALQALDHEDPRYFGSGQRGVWKRTKYAVVHTFVVRKDDGSWMPAYSLFAVDYGMPYIVGSWWSERFQSMNRIEAGNLNVTASIGSNLFREFWPDLRKRLPKRLLKYAPPQGQLPLGIFSSPGN